MSGYHEVEFSVRDYELDKYGVVNNAIFANYCQHACCQLMEKIGINIDTIAQTGNAVALSELLLKYIAPLKIGDKLMVRVRVSDTSAARVYFKHFIVKIPNEEPGLEACATVVWLDKSYRPVRIPPDGRSKIVQFIRHVSYQKGLTHIFEVFYWIDILFFDKV
ncbi:putative Thioesterase domain, HotDog domain superfamily [Helianthus annuus]|uniref:HotDog domain superfamily protein n=1 Tax=Helianthus annuus TaxID=4232 RepID=A0A251TJH8_HELAN|nr:putative HotDog domain superfamily protein [Helianthus annuus]KAJ0437936.1 putative Thioesterase domain, HotDog domain superfamily [Helianthus annuus]KAJ0460258.1 putative Thioesterase domain, HotDog domain superfamily [Helianthus annuus]KAJ0640696.1 putative Thioesterase domain, HotDog domain superfamily [Helianthus annuus]KAJ0644619.1 putative Thioesterase domain, HotDog domain superfamily [Helianthus annuus]